MSSLFHRTYSVRYTESHDRGDTWHPAAQQVVASSAHNACLAVCNSVEDSRYIAILAAVEVPSVPLFGQ